MNPTIITTSWLGLESRTTIIKADPLNKSVKRKLPGPGRIASTNGSLKGKRAHSWLEARLFTNLYTSALTNELEGLSFGRGVSELETR